MFSKRKGFSRHYKFDRSFLEKLILDLKSVNFDQITVKLPHNLVQKGKDEIQIEEFLERERNYPSIILIAKNENTREVIKILFVNISTKAFFKDDTFPSGHSETPELYVQSPDPTRTYALSGFFYDYLKSNSTAKGDFLWFLFIISFIFIISEFLYLPKKSGLLAQNLNISPVFDILVIFMSFILIFKFFFYDVGLYVKEKENKYLSSIRRAIKGEFRDNPIINLLATIIGGLIVLIIAKLLGLL